MGANEGLAQGVKKKKRQEKKIQMSNPPTQLLMHLYCADLFSFYVNFTSFGNLFLCL